MKITRLIIKTRKDKVPVDIYAVFSDEKRLHLDYQTTWRQCFAVLSGGRIERWCQPFLHHITTDGINSPWANMTRTDWAKVCFAYRNEMEA